MKTSQLLPRYLRSWLFISLFMALILPIQNHAAQLDQPSINSVYLDGNEVVVTVIVPVGIVKVTLESRSRLGAGAWAPVAVSRLDRKGGTLTFRLPRSSNLELMRVRADAVEALPASFYQGTNQFTASPGTSTGPSNAIDAAAGGGKDSSTPPTSDPSQTTRTVVESDIWTINGNTLYFFNQYRGLQVIDLSQPQSPALTGTLDLPAAGEQMYSLSTDFVVLLARNGCNWWGGDVAASQVIIVGITNGVPSVAATVPFPGQSQESRLVGTALYVAAETYRPVAGDKNGSWEWGTAVTSFDLSNPSAPVVKGTLWYAGYGNIIMANDQYFFVSISDPANWYHSIIHYIDISSPDGTMVDLSSIASLGRVDDKFKMNIDGDTFTVISETWDQTRRFVTTLQTFSLADPLNPQKLGFLQLAEGEQLHATSFAGNRVYVVTFFRVDPLWVVDLSDPANPAIKGEVQVPGWSTYIRPLGDKLVTIGIDNSNSWKVAVSLFDVHDPAHPSLVSKVPLGDSYSWSEANYDEKAFGVLPDAGLILVPYQGYSTNGYASQVQLIDLNLNDPSTNALRLRGVIPHQFQPRRATLYRDFILSLSGQELLSVDAADRDNPILRSALALAWSVDKVFLQGNYLLEISSSYVGMNQNVPVVRVTPADNPVTVLGQLALTNGLPIAGSVVRNGKLYLAQAVSSGWMLPMAKSGDASGNPATNLLSFVVSIVDLSQLPALKIIGQTSADLGSNGVSGVQAVWPTPNLLVWSGGNYNNYWLGVAAPAGGAANVIGGIIWWPPWYWGGNSGRLLAFNVADASHPAFVSEVNVTTNQWWSFSSAFTTPGLVYLSHQGSEFLPGISDPSQPPPAPTVVYDDKTGQYLTNQPPLGVWVQRYYLDVVDYADPANPVVRKPVNIPGQLNNVSPDGALLYTVGYHWTIDSTMDWTEWLDASSYDSVAAHLVDSLALKNWPHPVLVQGTNIFIGFPDTTTNQLNTVETWALSETGRFARLGAITQSSAASTMVSIDSLLTVRPNDNTLYLYNTADPAKLKLLVHDSPSGCLWGDLTKADGAVDRGVWVPLGDYGVQLIPLNSASAP